MPIHSNKGIGNHINRVSNLSVGKVMTDITSTLGGIVGKFLGGPEGAIAGKDIGYLAGRLMNVFV